jgi:hypothetical protein
MWHQTGCAAAGGCKRLLQGIDDLFMCEDVFPGKLVQPAVSFNDDPVVVFYYKQGIRPVGNDC